MLRGGYSLPVIVMPANTGYEKLGEKINMSRVNFHLPFDTGKQIMVIWAGLHYSWPK